MFSPLVFSFDFLFPLYRRDFLSSSFDFFEFLADCAFFEFPGPLVLLNLFRFVFERVGKSHNFLFLGDLALLVDIQAFLGVVVLILELIVPDLPGI